jgi:proteasome accessory factor A
MTRTTVPKIVGADVELSNFLLGPQSPEGTGRDASRLLLAAIDGIESGTSVGREALDWGRKYLPANGGCVYIDSNHLEIALPETSSAFDHVACWRAMLQLVRRTQRAVNDRLPDGCTLQVLANCSDGLGHSYGSHVNVLVTRRAWDEIIRDKPHYLAYLAAFQISSIVYTGQGKVGSERLGVPADFQLSQRADFIRRLTSLDTMVDRGVINTRDEAHCGPPRAHVAAELARLHVIFFDSTLSQTATLLRIGTMQMVTAMLEAGVADARLALEDPLDALSTWSRDPMLSAVCPLVTGTPVRAVELQIEFLEAARRFADRGGFDGIVPDAGRILALWGDTLRKLEVRDFDALSRRLDWVAKLRMITSVLDRRRELAWDSAAIKQLDQMYASLDDDGPFWTLERAGQMECVVTEEAVEHAGCEPPYDTRAWTRARLLRLAGDARVERVDWDAVHVRTAARSSPFGRIQVVRLPVPFESTRAHNEQFFKDGAPLEVVVDALRATDAWPEEEASATH